jgi:hypothetical protein
MDYQGTFQYARQSTVRPFKPANCARFTSIHFSGQADKDAYISVAYELQEEKKDAKDTR